MKNYEKPIITVIKFEEADVLASSVSSSWDEKWKPGSIWDLFEE